MKKLVLIISYLSILHVLEVWHVFLIGSCLSFTAAFFNPAVQAIIPDIVEKEKLTEANGMSQMVSGICTVAGPLFGAIAVSTFGLTWVFLANSFSYFISAFLTCFIKINGYEKSCRKADIRKELSEGIHFIKNQRKISMVLFIIAAAHLYIGSLSVILPFLAKGLTGNGVNNLGCLEMMLGAGMFAGSVFMSVRKKTVITVRTLILFIMAVGFCFIIISISQYIGIQTVYIYMLVMLAIGVCIAFASVFWQSLLQTNTPGHMTGRVFSVSTLIGDTTLPIAYGIFGVLLNVSSIFCLMAVSGVCLMVLCICLYLRMPCGKDSAQDNLNIIEME